MESTTIRRILIPTDFSAAADEAVQVAMLMARAFGAAVELLHVTATIAMLPPPIELVPFTTLMPDLSRRVQAKLVEGARRVQDAGIACETRSVEGSPAVEIVRRADEMGADVIVMGTHGHGGLAHAVLGSVTERVLHRAHCPVLAVPVRRPA